MMTRSRTLFTRLFAILFVVVISIWVFSIRDRADELANHGYLGIFVISFMAYATIILPAPGIAIVVAMAAVFNPFYIGLVAGAGAALGEVVGYMAGYSGQVFAEKFKYYQSLVRITQRFGPAAVFVLSAIPNPLFDFAGAAAGSLKMPVIRFFLACWAGETVKMLVFAYGGASVGQWLIG